MNHLRASFSVKIMSTNADNKVKSSLESFYLVSFCIINLLIFIFFLNNRFTRKISYYFIKINIGSIFCNAPASKQNQQ